MTLNRRKFLVATAGMCSSVRLLSAVVAAQAAPRYTWSKGAMDGGGYCNAIAADPLHAGRAAVAGDVWGEFTTDTSGDYWYPTMTGAASIGDIYGRAVAFSRKVPGLRYYGIGVLKNAGSHNGYLGAVAPGSLRLERRNSRINFSTYLPTGCAGDVPRAVGNLLAVDHDPASGIEYLYALTRQGLMRSTDGGATFASLGLAAVAPAFAWSALCLCPDGSLLAASYRTSPSGGSQVWRVANPRGAASISADLAAPAVVEDIDTINGRVYAACGPFGMFVVDAARGWTALAPTVFSGCHMSSVAGGQGVLWVGNGIGMPDHRYVARSHDGGRTFTWTTLPANIGTTVWGTTRAWWLAGCWPSMDKQSYSVSQLAVDAHNPLVCYAAGRSGVYATRDGGATWRPAMNGLDGSEIQQVQLGAVTGQAWAADTDWQGIQTQNHWQTCQRTKNPAPSPLGHTTSLVRTGATTPSLPCQVVLSNPRQMLVGGVDVADDFFRSACITPTDLAVAADGYLYVGLCGGGVLVGRPA